MSEERRHTGRRRPGEDGSRGWSDAAVSQGAAGAAGNWKRQGRILCYRLRREHGLADILILDFEPPELEENKFLLLKATKGVFCCQ